MTPAKDSIRLHGILGKQNFCSRVCFRPICLRIALGRHTRHERQAVAEMQHLRAIIAFCVPFLLLILYVVWQQRCFCEDMKLVLGQRATPKSGNLILRASGPQELGSCCKPCQWQSTAALMLELRAQEDHIATAQIKSLHLMPTGAAASGKPAENNPHKTPRGHVPGSFMRFGRPLRGKATSPFPAGASLFPSVVGCMWQCPGPGYDASWEGGALVNVASLSMVGPATASLSGDSSTS